MFCLLDLLKELIAYTCIKQMTYDTRRICRPFSRYFPVSATQEMLDEWRPLLCPFDVTNIKAIHYFEYFLPTDLPPEHHDKGFK